MSNNLPVLALQNVTEKRGLGLPFYYFECVAQRPRSVFKCVVKACAIEAIGYGTSKKNAKLEAARSALEVLNPLSLFSPDEISESYLNFVGELNNFVQKYHLHYPTYQEAPFHGSAVVFVTICQLEDYYTEGYGANATESKNDAARNMLRALNIIGQISAKRPSKKRKRSKSRKQPKKMMSVQYRLDCIKSSITEAVSTKVSRMECSSPRL